MLPPAIAWQDPLAAVLQLALLADGPIDGSELPLLTTLEPDMLQRAGQALQNLQVAEFDKAGGTLRLTDRQTAAAMARLPVHPRLACMIVRCGQAVLPLRVQTQRSQQASLALSFLVCHVGGTRPPAISALRDAYGSLRVHRHIIPSKGVTRGE